MTKSERILIGRKADGEKVYVQARLEYLAELYVGEVRQATDHTETRDRLRLAIQGVVVSKYGNLGNDRCWTGCGQTVGDLLELTTLADGWTVGDVARLHQIWMEWHLNDANAGCIHQSYEDQSDCPETGYRYGSAWLYKSLPYDVFAWICERFDIEPPAPGSPGTE